LSRASGGHWTAPAVPSPGGAAGGGRNARPVSWRPPGPATSATLTAARLPAGGRCHVPGRGCRGEAPPSGVLATRIARRLVVLAGRAARRSRVNVRHPTVAQVSTAQPFALDGLPRTPPRRPRSVAGRDAPSARAASLASSAALPRSPGDRRHPAQLGGGDPTATLRQSLRHSPATDAYPFTVWRLDHCWLCPRRGVERPG
jgi:hypothetical protein